MAQQKKISTQDLCEGVFVAGLDRPWLETPFLFQGFVVRNESDIDELRKHCRHVFIDAERSDPQAFKNACRRLPGPGPSARPSFLKRLMRRVTVPVPAPPISETVYEDRRELREELPQAIATVEKANALVREAMQELRVTDTLVLPLMRKAVDPIIDSVLRNKDAMAWMQTMESKDDYTYFRSVACSVWSVIFGRHLGFDRETLAAVGMGGLLLDIGKTRIPDELLTRAGPLAQEEMALMRQHVEFGLEILSETGNSDPRIAEMVRQHHERHNGTGYPDGLKGDEISTFGKLAGIVDSFVAMTSERPYAGPMATYDVMRLLNELSDVDFHSELVEQFIQAIGMFPTGTLVELSTGEIGVVVEQNRVRRLRPKVKILLDPDKQFLDEFHDVDLRETTTDESGRVSLWIVRGLRAGAYDIDPAEFFL